MGAKLLLGAGVALALLVSPAPASPPAESHDLPVGGCGSMGLNTDPTNPWSTRYEGAIDCEVLWLTRNDDAGPTTTHATVTFTLQTELHHDGGGVLASCTVTSAAIGFVAVGGCPVGFDIAPSQTVQWCTAYTWSEGATGSFVYLVDEDPVRPGIQCGTPVRFRVTA